MLHPASFHQVLSNAALNLAALRGKGSVREQEESLKHHTTALRIIAKDISDPEKSTSDGVIGAIVGFGCYSVSRFRYCSLDPLMMLVQHVIGNQAGFHMHMKAAKELIQLRGGINTLYSNSLLRIIVFWYVSHNNSLRMRKLNHT
jgi:hypothetical protein